MNKCLAENTIQRVCEIFRLYFLEEQTNRFLHILVT